MCPLECSLISLFICILSYRENILRITWMQTYVIEMHVHPRRQNFNQLNSKVVLRLLWCTLLYLSETSEAYVRLQKQHLIHQRQHWV